MAVAQPPCGGLCRPRVCVLRSLCVDVCGDVAIRDGEDAVQGTHQKCINQQKRRFFSDYKEVHIQLTSFL